MLIQSSLLKTGLEPLAHSREVTGLPFYDINFNYYRQCLNAKAAIDLS